MIAESVTVHDRYSESEIAQFYAAGFWRHESLYDMIQEHAGTKPDKVSFFDSTTSLTYKQLGEQVLRLAVGLRRLGISKGDRVAAQLPNWTEFTVVAAALNRIGGIIVPIMPIYRANDVGYVLGNAGVVATISAQEFKGFNYTDMFRELQASMPSIRHVIAARATDPLGSGAISLESLYVDGDLAALEEEAGPDSSPDDPFEIVYTSGTTSRPKGCYHTLNTARASSYQIASAVNYTEDDVQFGPSPVTHSTGLVTSVLIPLTVGASSHFVESWEPVDGLRRIKEYGITMAVTATPFLQMLMAAYDPAEHDTSSLRVWICAGSPIPGSVVERASQLFPTCRTLSLLGRSENLLTTMCTLDDTPERSVTSDGRAVVPSRVKILDEAGNELPRGEEGDISFWGASNMLGYYANEEETAKLFTADGFARSGDLGRMDEDGYVRVSGRLKDIIIRGGMNISAREIEDHLLDLDAVKDVAVVAMPDSVMGEKVCAYIVAHDGASVDLAEIKEFLLGRELAIQKVPERIEMTNALPTTATGKVQKHHLRADIAEKLGKGIPA